MAVIGGSDEGSRADAAPDAALDAAPDGALDGGEPVREDVIRVHRPADRALLGSLAVDDAGAVARAVSEVRAVQKGWGELAPRDRARRMAGLRREIGRRTDEIADRIIAETGKPEVEALTEVVVVLSLLGHYESVAPRLLGRRRVSPGWMIWKRAYVVREPWGVVGVISPWNYPFILSMEPVLTALMAGNGAVLKPSEHTPFTGELVEELAMASGLPEGLVRVVQGRAATGAALVRSGVDRLHFTGSAGVARSILASAADLLLPVSLELGGKDPALVLEDADLERAARGIAFGAFFNAGQTCLSTERVYVVEAVYEPFLRLVTRVARNLRVGSAGEVDVGPLVLDRQLERVERHVSDAVARGARVLTGGHRADPASNVFLPTVIADVDPGADVMCEETFGPLLPVSSVRDEDEGVARANGHPMALFASVWTGDRARGERVARRLRAGGVSVNDTLAHWAIPGLPMGGVGESGYSRTRGREGLLELSRARAVMVNRGPNRSEPWWFPYGSRGRRLTRALLGWERHRGIRGLLAAAIRAARKEDR